MPVLTWRDQLQLIMENHEPSEVLEAIAVEAAHYRRVEIEKRKSWERVRSMILKTAAVAHDVGL